jgi:hypothetical protein
MYRLVLCVAALATLAVTGCGDSDTDAGDATPVIDPGDGGNYRPDIEPTDFVESITNPYLPYTPGSQWVYESDDGSERIEVTVLEETRQVMGVTATVVRDTVYEDGEMVEDTYDWFAQDRDGNVWYLGEDTAEYEDGEVVSTAGAWEAGVDGAKPGIVMLAKPKAGDAYRQEYYAGEAEDMGRVVELGASATVPFGEFEHLLVTEDWTPLEPEVVERKYYAPGIGLVLEEKVAGEEGRVELISFEPGR